MGFIEERNTTEHDDTTIRGYDFALTTLLPSGHTGRIRL